MAVEVRNPIIQIRRDYEGTECPHCGWTVDWKAARRMMRNDGVGTPTKTGVKNGLYLDGTAVRHDCAYARRLAETK